MLPTRPTFAATGRGGGGYPEPDGNTTLFSKVPGIGHALNRDPRSSSGRWAVPFVAVVVVLASVLAARTVRPPEPSASP